MQRGRGFTSRPCHFASAGCARRHEACYVAGCCTSRYAGEWDACVDGHSHHPGCTQYRKGQEPHERCADCYAL